MNIDTDKLVFYLEKQMNLYCNAGLYEIIDIWEKLNDGELEYGELETIPKPFFQGFQEGIVKGLQIVIGAVKEAEGAEWSILR